MAEERDETPNGVNVWDESPDIHFEPVIKLPEVDTKTLEEDEEELLKLRARLYRYSSTEVPAEWKERGTGDVKLLKHRERGTIRLLMRREKTLKICANHYITPWMQLKPNCGSDRAWVWSVAADFADEEPKEEMLAIKFGNAENAKKFKEIFEQCKTELIDQISDSEEDSLDESSEVLKKLDDLRVKEDDDDPKSETKTDDKVVEKSESNLDKSDSTSKEQESDKD